ncbi:haloacid dehalogenase [Mycena filopes]|nr:haloacid dehalogenase [Mycena filopes]
MPGPCVVFGYASVTENLQKVLPSQATASGAAISPDLFFSAWTYNAEIDFQYLSILQKYSSHSTLLKKAFYKTMKEAGIATSSVAEADIDQLVSQYAEGLTPRPGLAEMMQTLRDGKFTVWCCSDATPERVRGYFAKAGIEMPMENLLSCDMCKAAKPDPKVYKMAKERLSGAEVTVFAAAHAWDLAGAKNAGFNTAYCTVLEDESCVDLFGTPDVIADTLSQLGSAIVKKWGKGAAI